MTGGRQIAISPTSLSDVKVVPSDAWISQMLIGSTPLGNAWKTHRGVGV